MSSNKPKYFVFVLAYVKFQNRCTLMHSIICPHNIQSQFQNYNFKSKFQTYFEIIFKVTVPDRRCRIFPEVVLVRRWVTGVLGTWRGEGLEKGLGQGRSVYKQPETEVDGSCHSQEGSK